MSPASLALSCFSSSYPQLALWARRISPALLAWSHVYPLSCPIGVLPCLLVYCVLSGNLKPANQAVHGTNHSKYLESLDFRRTVWRTGTACGIGTVGFLRLIKVLGPSGQEILAVIAANRPV